MVVAHARVQRGVASIVTDAHVGSILQEQSCESSVAAASAQVEQCLSSVHRGFAALSANLIRAASGDAAYSAVSQKNPAEIPPWVLEYDAGTGFELYRVDTSAGELGGLSFVEATCAQYGYNRSVMLAVWIDGRLQIAVPSN